MGKKIVGLKVIKAGSNPDVDSDFSTEVREEAIKHVTDLYGKNNVANIITYNTLAAKSAFKEMCTIYEIPFTKANQITALIPKPVEGKDLTLAEIFDPTHERYSEGADFRAAVSDDYWKDVLEGAISIEGRTKSIGMHPCFTAGTLILTDKGYTKIENIKEGDLVLTHKNKFNKVVELQKNKSSNIYELKTNNSTIIKATGNHPFYVRSYDKNKNLRPPKWKELEKLTKNDLIGVCINKEETIPVFDNFDLPFDNPEFWEIIGNIYGKNHIRNTNLYHSINSKDFYKFLHVLFLTGESIDFLFEDVLNLPIMHLKYFINGYLTNGKYIEENNEEVFLTIISIINKVYKKSLSEIKSKKFNYTGTFEQENNSLYENGYLWVPIESLVKLNNNDETVYNLSVLDDNSYTANNLMVHNCGIIMSDKPLHEVLPLYVRQEDNRVMTQWTYGNCEELGLIKMDFLGLDTVDLIQNTLENIKKNGKTPPNMLDFIHGPMDDKKTFDLIKAGKTMGIFQFSSSEMQELLVRMQAREFDDLVAANALYRPGPMASNAHLMYADRRAGREKAQQSINPEFNGTVLEEILKKTQNLIIFQEQIMQISNQIAGMTLQEGDELRSAMGKKKKEKMDKMKPIFISGGMKNGFSEKAMLDLWNTMEPFAKYAFNKSHSVAYSMNAIQAAYLKAHYPVEFISALISQHLSKKDKVLAYLKEAREMGLTIASVDINKSDIKVSPNYKKETKNDPDILYGFSGVKAVSEVTASAIISERETNGEFSSVQDFITRCQKKNIGNKRVYQNLALAGAFDSFGVSRKGVVDNIGKLIDEGKTKKEKGESLFEMFIEEGQEDGLSLDLSGFEEYEWVEKLKLEADTIGLFLTGHPLENIGTGLSNLSTTTIKKILDANENVVATLPVSIIEISRRSTKRGKLVQVSLDDGTGYLNARLSQPIIKGIDKKKAIERIKTLYINGESNVPNNFPKLISSPDVVPYNDIEKNNVYLATISYKKSTEDLPYVARVENIRPLFLARNGMLPIRIRLDEEVIGSNLANKLDKALAKNLNDKRSGEYPIYKVKYNTLPTQEIVDTEALNAINEMKTTKTSGKRTWPPKNDITFNEEIKSSVLNENKIYTIETLEYEDTGYTAAKTIETKQAIEKFLGDEGYDFGAFDGSLFE